MAIKTLREQGLAAAFAALAPLGGEGGIFEGRVWRNRKAPVEEGQTGIVMMDGGHETYGEEQTYSRTIAVEFAVEVSVTAADDDATTDAIDLAYAEIAAALLADYTLGGKVRMIEETGFDGPDLLDPRGSPYGAQFVVRFIMLIDHDPADPRNPAPA